MRDRALRREYVTKAKTRVRRRRPDVAGIPRLVGRLARTPSPCSTCCGNRRKIEGPTLRERIDDVAEQYDDLFVECFDAKRAVDDATAQVFFNIDFETVERGQAPNPAPAADVTLDELAVLIPLQWYAYGGGGGSKVGGNFELPPVGLTAHYRFDVVAVPQWVLHAYGAYVRCPHCGEQFAMLADDEWCAKRCRTCDAPLAIHVDRTSYAMAFPDTASRHRSSPYPAPAAVVWSLLPHSWTRHHLTGARAALACSCRYHATYPYGGHLGGRQFVPFSMI